MSGSPGHPPPIAIQLSRRSLWALGALLTAPWLLIALLFFSRQSPAPPAFTESTPATFIPQPASVDAVVAGAPGPWGKLEYVRILIEPPEDQINAAQRPVTEVTWSFPGYDRAGLAGLWERAELSPAELAALNDAAVMEITDEGIRLRVRRELALGLQPNTRKVIYTALSAFPENSAQHEPFRFRADAAEEWFRDSGLHEDTIRTVKQLLYRRGTSLLFSDIDLILSQLPSLAERIRLVKTLARKSTLLVRLRLDPDADIDELDRYWGRGPRSKDIRPLLQSLPRAAPGASIDIMHLLPRFARSLLYTYPSPADPGTSSYLDCHWTALNFFNAIPDRRFEAIEAVAAAFRNDYHPVTGAPTFGDVIMLANPGGDIFHSCVFIADNIVFTKNGANPSSPWILMTLDDVVAFYPSDEPFDIQLYRAKNIPTNY